MRIILGLGGDILANKHFAINGFRTIEDVKGYQSALLVASTGYSPEISTLTDKIIKTERDRLEDLLGKLLANEQKFKDILGDVGISYIEKRINNWNSHMGLDLVNSDEIFSEELKSVLNEIADESFQNNFHEALSSYPELREYFSVETVKTWTPDIIREFKRSFESKTGINLRNMRRTYIGVAERTNEIKDITDNIKFDISFQPVISANYRKKIKDFIEKTTNYKFHQIITKEKQKVIENIFRNFVRRAGISRTGPGQYFVKVITEQSSKFDINRSTFSIKGFLGEVYWTAFWRYITNDKISVSPQGATYATAGNVPGQIPIDMFLQDIGIQIKNYSLINLQNGSQGVHFPPTPNTMNVNNFIRLRLDLPDTATAYERFMFSYGYNKVLDNEDAQAKYAPIFNRFDTILRQFMGNLESISMKRIDKIISLDREFGFESDVDLFNTNNLEERYNTIYIIGDKFVFGSDIVRAIIHGLESQEEVKVSLSHFRILNTSEPFVGATYPESSGYKIRDLMNNYKLEYQIEIDVNALTSSILGRIRI